MSCHPSSQQSSLQALSQSWCQSSYQSVYQSTYRSMYQSEYQFGYLSWHQSERQLSRHLILEFMARFEYLQYQVEISSPQSSFAAAIVVTAVAIADLEWTFVDHPLSFVNHQSIVVCLVANLKPMVAIMIKISCLIQSRLPLSLVLVPNLQRCSVLPQSSKTHIHISYSHSSCIVNMQLGKIQDRKYKA